MVAKSKIVKAKTKRGKRFLEGRKPKEFENVKKAMFIRGGRTNETVTKALKQFYMLKKPFSLMLQKKNMLKPFEDQTSLEYLAQKSDHSLFMFGFNSKKRPNSLIIGRTYDNQVLDMFELGVESMKTMDDFKVPKITLGIKPCLTFSGEAFEIDPEYIRLKCMLADFFKGEVVENIRLQGLEHVYNFTAVEGKVYLRSYRVIYKNSETKVPNVELEEIGPSLDLKLSRTKLASDALYKTAQKQSKLAVVKKKKNVSRDGLGTTFGRIHMEKQDFGKLQLRKVRALKTVKAKKGEAAESNSNENSTTAATEVAATD